MKYLKLLGPRILRLVRLWSRSFGRRRRKTLCLSGINCALVSSRSLNNRLRSVIHSTKNGTQRGVSCGSNEDYNKMRTGHGRARKESEYIMNLLMHAPVRPLTIVSSIMHDISNNLTPTNIITLFIC